MEDWVGVWREILGSDSPTWVVFKQGTCVLLYDPGADATAAASALLAEVGPVQTGSPAADFFVSSHSLGWVVGCHHPDVLAFVAAGETASDLAAGLAGRSRRDQDARELEVVHTEVRPAQARPKGPPEEERLSGEVPAPPMALEDGEEDSPAALFVKDMFRQALAQNIVSLRLRPCPGESLAAVDFLVNGEWRTVMEPPSDMVPDLTLEIEERAKIVGRRSNGFLRIRGRLVSIFVDPTLKVRMEIGPSLG